MGSAAPATNGNSSEILPTSLPGAFLFFTYKLKSGETFAGISYDPDVVETTKLKELVNDYFDRGLPYTEKFTPIPAPDGQPVWEEPNTSVSYGGIYGGADPKAPGKPSRIAWSSKWPWSRDTDDLRNGVHMLYWNYKGDKNKGMCTSGALKSFKKENKIPFVGLFPGPGKAVNLVPSGSSSVVTELYLDHYATKWNKSLGWEKLV
ncbi:hypothetical protein G7054_g10769 [Neopestalotiopsis clavispora]|nr:hypothetical protein G7054_g10769 [Neopestalotiopsis clavispora]